MKTLDLEASHVLAANGDRAGAGVIEAHEQACERRLSGAGSADDAHGLACGGLEAHVLERGCAGARIGEGDV